MIGGPVDDGTGAPASEAARQRERTVLLPPGRWIVEVLDIWECTIDQLPSEQEFAVHVPLPARPCQAIRLTALEDAGVVPRH